MNNYRSGNDPYDENSQDPTENLQERGLQDSLDRILVQEEALAPSSGFAASVMNAIREETLAPAPIPFPWKFALPGIAAVLAALVFAVRFAASAIHNLGASPGRADILSGPQLDLILSPLLHSQVGPALLALAGAFVCMMLCLRLAGGWSAR